MISRLEKFELEWILARRRRKQTVTAEEFDARHGGDGRLFRDRLSPLCIEEREGKLYLTEIGRREAEA